nr:destrin-like [Monopterus albus]
MASGVKVADQVKEIYNEMKVVKNDAVQEERIRFVLFDIKDGYICVKEIYREKDLSGVDDVFKFVMNLMDPKKCCYWLYDCHFETCESKKEELVFALWAPESANIKCKMQFASSKDSIKKTMLGIKHEMQINDAADFNREDFAHRLGKTVTKLEGHPVCCRH